MSSLKHKYVQFFYILILEKQLKDYKEIYTSIFIFTILYKKITTELGPYDRITWWVEKDDQKNVVRAKNNIKGIVGLFKRRLCGKVIKN